MESEHNYATKLGYTLEELYRKANYDPTTELPNRQSLLQHINQLIDKNINFGFLLIDIDNFKLFNTSLGHSFGDTLLKKIAARLKTTLSEADFVARLSGDEFAVVTRLNREQALLLAAKCIKSLSAEPIVANNQEFFVGASIGAAFYPLHGKDADSLLKSTDLAIHQSKINGKGRLHEYDISLNEDLSFKLGIVNKLRTALARNEFLINYQPQVSADCGHIVGIEALLRWNQPELGLVGPDKFIPILEETGLIVPVGKWVLETSCRQAAAWHQAGHYVRLSVNVSARQFQESDLPSMICHVLDTTGFDPTFLCLEITESLLVNNSDQIKDRLKSITELGVTFSIDDFGTGYSSMSYLQQLPINEVKIDRAFIRNLTLNSGDAVIVKAIYAMASSMGMLTVAEGVEDQDQLSVLREIGVEMIQGYLIGRPMSGHAMSERLGGVALKVSPTKRNRSCRTDSQHVSRQLQLSAPGKQLGVQGKHFAVTAVESSIVAHATVHTRRDTKITTLTVPTLRGLS